MPGILVDANIEGQAARIGRRLHSAAWRELTLALDVRLLSFRDLALDPRTPDDELWRYCQANGYYLLTSNRNEASEASLEATIRREGTGDSLPVFTLAVPDRVYESPAFLERVVDRLLSFVLDADRIRGCGRLYLP